MNKLKVLLICHFSNAKVREHLPLDERRLYNFVRKLLGMPNKGKGYGDIAAWDTYIVEQLRKRDNIDLHVISAHSGLRKSSISFFLEGVHYYFVRCDYATMLKHLIPSASLWHQLNPMRPIVRKLVRQISPDIIALIGAENPHISGTILGIKNIPLIVKCQTIYNNPERRNLETFNPKNAYVEQQIFKNLQYVSVTTKMHEQLFRTMNPTAHNFKWDLGNLLPEVEPVEKKYDFVNYAMSMSDKKGYPDAINALSIVKEHYSKVKLNLIGGATKEYREELDTLVDSLGLKENVVFTPFFERQEDLFQHLQQSRYALLPCKLDYVASTIRQAMHYELPVVCYKTEGTVALNQEKECVLIAENGNQEALASQMLKLMTAPQKAETLRLNAKEYSKRWDDDERNSQQMIDIFKAVIDNYNNGTPIPQNLLYKS